MGNDERVASSVGLGAEGKTGVIIGCICRQDVEGLHDPRIILKSAVVNCEVLVRGNSEMVGAGAIIKDYKKVGLLGNGDIGEIGDREGCNFGEEKGSLWACIVFSDSE